MHYSTFSAFQQLTVSAHSYISSNSSLNRPSLFQILKDGAVKMLHSICLQIWKTQQWPQNWKRSVFISIPKKGNAKECSNYHTTVSHLTCQQSNAQNSLSSASRVHELRTSQMLKLDLEKA